MENELSTTKAKVIFLEVEKEAERNELEKRLADIQESISAQIKTGVKKEQNDSQVLFETFKTENSQIWKGLEDTNKMLSDLAGM